MEVPRLTQPEDSEGEGVSWQYLRQHRVMGIVSDANPSEQGPWPITQFFGATSGLPSVKWGSCSYLFLQGW